MSDDNTIRVGDLVAVVRNTPCCNKPRGVGNMFTVVDMASPGMFKGYRCNMCKAPYPRSEFSAVGAKHIYLVSRLQKIHPPKKALPAKEKEIVYG